MNRIVGIALASTLLAGCAAVGTTGAPTREVANSRELQADYQALWSRTLSWLASNRISVQRADQAEGAIGASFRTGEDRSDLDCGEPTGNQGVYVARFEDTEGHVEVLFRSGIDAATDVTVNVRGETDVVIRNVFGGVLQKTSTRCGSSGRLEQRLLDFLQQG